MVGREHYLTVAAALLVPFAVQAEVTLSGDGRTGFVFTCDKGAKCDDVMVHRMLFDDRKKVAPPHLPVLGFGPSVTRVSDFSSNKNPTPYDFGQFAADGQGQ
jgi:hypothetical protein